MFISYLILTEQGGGLVLRMSELQGLQASVSELGVAGGSKIFTAPASAHWEMTVRLSSVPFFVPAVGGALGKSVTSVAVP